MKNDKDWLGIVIIVSLVLMFITGIIVIGVVEYQKVGYSKQSELYKVKE